MGLALHSYFSSFKRLLHRFPNSKERQFLCLSSICIVIFSKASSERSIWWSRFLFRFVAFSLWMCWWLYSFHSVCNHQIVFFHLVEFSFLSTFFSSISLLFTSFVFNFCLVSFSIVFFSCSLHSSKGSKIGKMSREFSYGVISTNVATRELKMKEKGEIQELLSVAIFVFFFCSSFVYVTSAKMQE